MKVDLVAALELEKEAKRFPDQKAFHEWLEEIYGPFDELSAPAWLEAENRAWKKAGHNVRQDPRDPVYPSQDNVQGTLYPTVNHGPDGRVNLTRS